eukprot:1147581-Pelagomonas_calceolata.AAC.8
MVVERSGESADESALMEVLDGFTMRLRDRRFRRDDGAWTWGMEVERGGDGVGLTEVLAWQCARLTRLRGGCHRSCIDNATQCVDALGRTKRSVRWTLDSKCAAQPEEQLQGKEGPHCFYPHPPAPLCEVTAYLSTRALLYLLQSVPLQGKREPRFAVLASIFVYEDSVFASQSPMCLLRFVPLQGFKEEPRFATLPSIFVTYKDTEARRGPTTTSPSSTAPAGIPNTLHGGGRWAFVLER